jgi:microcystin-dependent protein
VTSNARDIIRRFGPSGKGGVPLHTHEAEDVSGTVGFLRILHAIIDGDIEITGDIFSTNYEEGVSGWRLSSDGTAQFNGQFFVAPGSAPVPGLTTLGDPDTGLFFGEGLGFTVDGAEVGRLVDGQLRMNPGTAPLPSYSFGAGVATTRASAVNALSPVAWWRFGAVTDETGGNNLTFAGSPAVGGAAGPWASDVATVFDGVNDEATVASEADVERQSLDRSYEFWFRPAVASSGVLMDISNVSADPIILYVSHSFTFGQSEIIVIGGGELLSAPCSFGAWHHLVITDNVGGGSVDRVMYLDGVEVGSDDTDDETGTMTVRIGDSNLGGANFNGTISEIAVYPTALSPSQVLALYSAQTETAAVGVDTGWSYGSSPVALIGSVAGVEVARFEANGLTGMGGGVPVGGIVLWGTTTAPAGYVLCDGAAINRTTYAKLFAVIGTTYGVGNGTTTFNVPNLQGRFPLGKASAGTGSTLGGTGGAIDHLHSQPTHVHDLGGHVHGVSGNTGTVSADHAHNFNVNTGFTNTGVGLGAAGGFGFTPDHVHNAAGGTGGITANHFHGIGFNTGGPSANSGAQGNENTGTNNPPFQVFTYIIRTMV